MNWRFTACVLISFFLVPFSLHAEDWPHWRGPLQNGVGFDKKLPDKVEGNILWRAPYGGISAPLVLGDKLYIIDYDADKIKVGDKVEEVQQTIQERVMCMDAKTGKKIWQHLFPIFHADIVTSRLGWTNLASDPATGYIYAHGTQGFFMCLDGKTGKVIWQHSMGEEYGRVTGYGGRITSPTIEGDLAILGMVNSSWGEQAKGANRFVAFNKKTGEVVWWSEPAPVKGTYYSCPIIATINGQRLIISGGSDGSVFAIQASTGVPVWRYAKFSISPINSTPVVDGNFVYIGHGEESAGTADLGRVICLDASKIEKGEPKLVWQVDRIKARYASPIFHDGKLYMPDDGGLLYCLDGKTGKQLWKYRYGRGEVRGSAVLADGKIYVGEVSARFHILTLQPGNKKCTEMEQGGHFFPGVGGVDVELNGTPAIANGCVYFTTTLETICIGLKDGVSVKTPMPPAPPKKAPGKMAHLQIIPAEIAIYPGESATFQARAFDADGDFIKDVKAMWTLPAGKAPPGAKSAPPALKGEITPDGKLTVDPKVVQQAGHVVGTIDGISGKARVRVMPRIPYANDFEKIRDGGVPAGWINTQGKWLVKTVQGNKVFAKVNDKFSPLFSRGHAYITSPHSKDYTIEADVQGTKIGSEMPDIGVGANRYTLSLFGNVQKLRLQSWEAVPRIDSTVAFKWQPDVWYHLKLTTDIHDGKGVIRGKAWPRGEKEPDAWTVVATDPRPIHEGAPTLYGYVTGNFNNLPGTEVYFDNLRITPNKK